MNHRTIGKVMTSDVVRVTYGAPFKEVAALLAGHGISGLPVVDEDEKVIGVVSATDLLVRQARLAEDRGEGRFHLPLLGRRARIAAAKARARTAGQLMSRPAVVVRPGNTVVEAARLMAEHRVERLPVIDEEDRLVGIVTRRDLLGVFLRPDSEIRREVIEEILVRSLWLAPSAIGVSVHDGVVTLEGRVERRSEIAIAVELTGRVDGVVAVVDKLTFRLDDSHLRLQEPAVHGVADGWLHRL